MNNILKAAKLDFFLVRPYIKYIAFSIAFPIILSVMNGSLLYGISFSMCFIGMTAGYTFSISEKNDMERLYSILPISKKHMVIGRYLYTCAMGLFALLISLAVHPVILLALGETVLPSDILVAALTGIIMFSLFTVFQLPGYYKYGFIKGRIFRFVPVAGYFVVMIFVPKIDLAGNSVLSVILNDPIILTAVLLLVCIIAFLLSIIASIRILQNKEA